MQFRVLVEVNKLWWAISTSYLMERALPVRMPSCKVRALEDYGGPAGVCTGAISMQMDL